MRTVLVAALAGALVSCTPAMSLAYSYSYGSIAYSPKTGHLTTALSNHGHKVSNRHALRRCREKAGDCEIAVWVKHGCAAVAAGKHGRYGYAYGKRLVTVRRNALRQCRTTTKSCKVVKAFCTGL